VNKRRNGGAREGYPRVGREDIREIICSSGASSTASHATGKSPKNAWDATGGVVKRSFSWLHSFRMLRIRYKRLEMVHALGR
jgi:hypothetical protein